MKLLSTKILTQPQRDILSKANIHVIEYNAIRVEILDFDDNIIANNAIITSQNAVKAIVNSNAIIKRCFCVGEKTKTALENNGINVIKMTHYGAELAHYIVNNYNNELFWFFCGNRRRMEIPQLLTQNQIPFKEIEVYKTILNKQHISELPEAVMFFSPSAIESFSSNNSLNKKTVFCIGKTTAEAAKRYTNKIHIASKPTIESVLHLAVEQLTNKNKR